MYLKVVLMCLSHTVGKGQKIKLFELTHLINGTARLQSCYLGSFTYTTKTLQN